MTLSVAAIGAPLGDGVATIVEPEECEEVVVGKVKRVEADVF